MQNLFSMLKNKISNSIFDGRRNQIDNVCSDSDYTNKVITNFKKFIEDNLNSDIYAKHLFHLFKSYDSHCKALKHYESSKQIQPIINNCQFDKKSYLLDFVDNIDLLNNIQFLELVYDISNINSNKNDNSLLNCNWFISFILFHKFSKYSNYLLSLNLYTNNPDKFLSRVRLDLGNDTCDVLLKIYGNNLVNDSGRFNPIDFSRHTVKENNLLLNKINLLDNRIYSNKSIIPKLPLIVNQTDSKKRRYIELETIEINDDDKDGDDFIPVKRRKYERKTKENNIKSFDIKPLSQNAFIPKPKRNVDNRSYASVVKKSTIALPPPPPVKKLTEKKAKDEKEEGEISDKDDADIIEIEESELKISPRRKRTLTESQKKKVASKQFYKCANKPGSKCVEDYDCPFWKCQDGSFDESGYEIDHILEFCLGGSDELTNCQALCVNCHRVKTSRFNMNRRHIFPRYGIKYKK